jgi:hypothetical protein
VASQGAGSGTTSIVDALRYDAYGQTLGQHAAAGSDLGPRFRGLLGLAPTTDRDATGPDSDPLYRPVAQPADGLRDAGPERSCAVRCAVQWHNQRMACRMPTLGGLLAIRCTVGRHKASDTTITRVTGPGSGSRDSYPVPFVALVTCSMASATTSATRTSSSSEITNGGPSRMVSPSVPSALPVAE